MKARSKINQLKSLFVYEIKEINFKYFINPRPAFPELPSIGKNEVGESIIKKASEETIRRHIEPERKDKKFEIFSLIVFSSYINHLKKNKYLVLGNVEIKGEKSKSSRQLDGIVFERPYWPDNNDYKQGIRLLPKSRILEIKYNKSKKLNVKVVDEFIGKLSDLNHQNGCIISYGNFTEKAINHARNANIYLYVIKCLEDNEIQKIINKSWQTNLNQNIYVENVHSGKYWYSSINKDSYKILRLYL